MSLSLADILQHIIILAPWYLFLWIVPVAISNMISLSISVPKDIGKEFIVTGLFAPFFEEMVFRGLPYYLFNLYGLGIYGLTIGSIIWSLLHIVPYFDQGYSTKQIILKSFPYITVIPFYVMAWSLDPVTPIFYHMINNIMVVIAEARSRKKEPRITFFRTEGSSEERETSEKPRFFTLEE